MRSTLLLLAVFTGCQLAQPLPTPEPSPQLPQLPYCGDGTCDVGENRFTCPQDCVEPPNCGDGVCNAFAGESCDWCPADCGACPAPPPPRCPDSISLGIALPIDRMDTAMGGDTATACGTTGPQIVYEWTAYDAGVYHVDVTGTVSLQVRHGDCLGPQLACGAQDVAMTAGESIAIALTGQGGFELTITRLPDSCGDGVCENSETCDACASDCGACPYCGDGTCNAGETCDSCSSDCGACSYCGDGVCDSGETCDSCSSDCGSC